jgi:hypothetical protein
VQRVVPVWVWVQAVRRWMLVQSGRLREAAVRGAPVKSVLEMVVRAVRYSEVESLAGAVKLLV